MTDKANQNLVSVVMAAYNAEDYVGAAIGSVLKQSYADLELIVVNDGSTDRTAEKIEKYLVDSRVRLITQNNAGQTIAKNRGIEEAQGAYIGFCDADDLWHEEKLEKQLSKIKSDESLAVVYSDTFLIDEKGSSVASSEEVPIYEGNLLEKLLYSNFIPFGTVLVRSSCLSEIGGFNERYRMGIDWDLWLRISTRWKISGVPEKLYYYRQWQGQMSRNYDGRYLGALEMKEFRQNHPGYAPKNIYVGATSDIYANYAYHVSLYEGYPLKLFVLIAKSIAWSPFRLATHKRVARALLKRF